MVYQVQGNVILFAFDRAGILDITVGDTIEVKGFTGVSYAWTQHDSDMVENNPDEDIFLEVTRLDDNTFKAVGLVI